MEKKLPVKMYLQCRPGHRLQVQRWPLASLATYSCPPDAYPLRWVSENMLVGGQY